MSKVYLFDVFDTLVIRKVGLPHHIHFQTGIHIQDEIDIEPELFANARIEVESKLRKEREGVPNIHTIYKKLKDKLEISDRTAEKLLKTELKTELDNIAPLNKNIKILKEYRNGGGRIIYISNTCHNREFIKRILRILDIYREGENVYTSCDYTSIKHGGDLIAHIKKNDLGLRNHELYYYGNHANTENISTGSDDKFKISLPNCTLNRFEKYLTSVTKKYNLSADTTLKYSKLAAASRHARVNSSTENQTIYDIAASVASPVLMNFISYVLKNSTGKKIYFTARDGYIMYEIAKKIIKEKNYDFEPRYLYVSREVMVLANADEMSYREYTEYLKKIFAHEKFQYVLDLFSIDTFAIENRNIENVDLAKKVSSIDPNLFESFFNDYEVKQKIYRESQNRKKRLLSYLDQEGLLDGEPITIVDSGWYLTIHNILAKSMKGMGKKPPEGFYFGINEPPNSSINNGKKYGYFWDNRKGDTNLKSRGIGLLLEVFCSAPHGRTLDYQTNGTSVKPLLDNHELDFLLEWGVDDLRRGILSSVEAALNNKTPLSPNKIDQEIFAGLIKRFWHQPTRQEVDIWGQYPFLITRDGETVITLHGHSTFLKTFKHIAAKGKLPNGNLDFWPYAYIYSFEDFRSYTLKYLLRLKTKFHFLKRSYSK